MKTLLIALLCVAAMSVKAGGDELCCLDDATSFAYSAENPTGRRGGGTDGKNRKPRSAIDIRPGETAVLAEIDGPGRIEHIWMTGSLSKSLVLRMYWDGQAHPSVEAPLTAFYGWAFCENLKTVEDRYPSYSSALLMTAPGMGMNCYFPMPFRKHAKIAVENRGAKRLCQYYMITGSRGEQPKDAAYFHASYRQACPVERGKPYTVIDGIAGRGRFVGVTLSAGVNEPGCWVEGEPRMFLDGETTPSLHYTGLEDYFCGAYAFGRDNKALKRYQTYTGLYTGVSAVFGSKDYEKGVQQRFMLYRFHVKDPIRFEKSFRLTFDDMRGPTPRADDFRTVAYWYQTLPSAPFKPLPPEDKIVVK